MDCGWEVMRDFKTRNSKTAKTAKEHRTGRVCKACGGDLHDTIINFGTSVRGWVTLVPRGKVLVGKI